MNSAFFLVVCVIALFVVHAHAACGGNNCERCVGSSMDDCIWCVADSKCYTVLESVSCENRQSNYIMEPQQCTYTEPTNLWIYVGWVTTSALSMLFFLLRRKQVNKFVDEYSAAKTGAADFSNLDPVTQNRFMVLVHPPDAMIWCDVSMPHPELSSLLLVVIANTLFMIVAAVTYPSVGFIFELMMWLVNVVYSIFLAFKVITRNKKYDSVYALTNFGATISTTPFLCGGETKRVLSYFQMNSSNISVRTGLSIGHGVGDLIFAYDMKDVTYSSQNTTHIKIATNKEKFSNLKEDKDGEDDIKVRFWGKIFQKGVGFKSIIRPYEVERILCDRVTAALNATQASEQISALPTVQVNTDPVPVTLQINS